MFSDSCMQRQKTHSSLFSSFSFAFMKITLYREILGVEEEGDKGSRWQLLYWHWSTITVRGNVSPSFRKGHRNCCLLVPLMCCAMECMPLSTDKQIVQHKCTLESRLVGYVPFALKVLSLLLMRLLFGYISVFSHSLLQTCWKLILHE